MVSEKREVPIISGNFIGNRFSDSEILEAAEEPISEISELERTTFTQEDIDKVASGMEEICNLLNSPVINIQYCKEIIETLKPYDFNDTVKRNIEALKNYIK